MDCLFCKMAAGEIPVNKVYEDDTVLAFHDIDPQAPVHFLVIPQNTHRLSAEINAENSAVVAHIFEVIAQIAQEMNLENGYRVVTNCGRMADKVCRTCIFMFWQSAVWPGLPG